VCDIDQVALSKVQEKYNGIKVTTDFEDVLRNNEITRVCIALPAHMHYEYVKRSLEAGKDVYVEKPFTLDIDNAKKLVKLAKEKNKIIMVGHLLHYHPAIAKIKNIISNGDIGEIKQIIANRYSLGIFRTFENVLWSFGVHDLSVILSLCGDEMPESVICNGNSIITPNIHDLASCILKYKDKYVNVNLNWLSPYKEQKLSIIGTKGMLVFDDVNKSLTHIPKYVSFSDESTHSNPIAVKNNEANIVYSGDFPLLRECQHFINSCNNREQPITDGQEGVRVVELLTHLQNSLENDGKEIYLKKSTINENIFIHDTAIVDANAEIGKGTKIWHYSHICAEAKIGQNCNIGQNVYIAGGAVLGDNCKVQNNVSIYKGVEAGNNVFFGPSCVLTNDLNPRCAHPKNGRYVKTILKSGVTLGANSTIVCGNTIGENALIGAGAVICKNVNANAVMVGNPAKKIGTIDELGTIKHYT
jgi:UDP-2-acetamido-3-amino-2,3-dideoxy-glucuronate N-acetyltransferase